MHRISRGQYTSLYGPLTGAKIRLGDTALVAEIERDTSVPGDECVYGGARSLRDTMGLAATRDRALDTVITNVVVIDWTGIYKADIGIKNGRIAGIGRAGHPDIMEAVTPGMVLGAGTQVIAGEGMVATAGAVDSNCAFVTPGLAEAALSGGITTVIGGGAGHASEFEPEAATPGARHIELMLRATDDLPLNVGLLGRAGAAQPHALVEEIRAGAAGLSLCDCWGTGAAALECALAVAIQFDSPVSIQGDAFNEANGFEEFVSALKGRPVRFNLGEGMGGGPAPDALRVCGENRVLAASSSGSLPSSANTLEELRASMYARRRMDPKNEGDAAFVEWAVRGGALAAQDILHDLGAIPIVASASQSMGRTCDMVARVWQMAHKMHKHRGRLQGEKGGNDNLRIRRYIAKYTINPALACGIAHEAGSLESGKLADIVLWKPEFFGRRPECVLKGGMIAWMQAGIAGAGLPRVEPVYMRSGFGAAYGAAANCSVAFVSKLSLRENTVDSFGLKKPLSAVAKWRKIGKQEMRLNDIEPKVNMDLHNLTVMVNGQALTGAPPENLPLAQRYSLF